MGNGKAIRGKKNTRISGGGETETGGPKDNEAVLPWEIRSLK